LKKFLKQKIYFEKDFPEQFFFLYFLSYSFCPTPFLLLPLQQQGSSDAGGSSSNGGVVCDVVMKGV